MHGMAEGSPMEVVWVNQASGERGTATGTTNWSTGSIHLNVGLNPIVVTATDSAARSGVARLEVIYSKNLLQFSTNMSAAAFVLAGTPFAFGKFDRNAAVGQVLTGGGVEHFFVVVGQDLVDQAGELRFPVVVLDPAAGLGQPTGEPDELFGSAAEAAAALEARSFHVGFLLRCSGCRLGRHA